MTPTFAQRLRWVVYRVNWAVVGIFAVMAAAAGVAAPFVRATTWYEPYILPAFVAVCLLAPLAHATVEYTRRGAIYYLWGARFIWGPEAVRNGDFITRQAFRRRLAIPWWSNRPGGGGGWKAFQDAAGPSRRELIGGCTVHVVGDEPQLRWWRDDDEAPDEHPIPDVDPDTPGIQSYGKTQAHLRRSYVYAPRALEMGTMGHELDMLAYWVVFPGERNFSEATKVARLQQIGVR